MKQSIKKQYNTLIKNCMTMVRVILCVYIFLGLILISHAGGNQNITINAAATSTTGTWTVTGASVPYSYTFQPNAATNVANLNVADIVACFTGSNTTLGGGGTPPNTNGKQGNVTILTASTGAGVGTGDVVISQAISTTLSSYTQFTLTITAAGAINVSNTISLKGSTGGGGIAAGYPGVHVILNSGTGISMTGGSGIQTDGGAGGAGGGAGGNAGAITMTATTGAVNLSISSTAIGGAGGGVAGGAGGAGGNVTLTATAGAATINNGVNNYGGASSNGNGGNGGSITLTAFTSTINVACNSYGGNGGGSGSGGTGGALTMSAPAGSITLGNTFNSNGGTGGSTGAGGNGGAWNLTALSTVTISVACTSNGGAGGSLSGNGGAGGAMSFISSASNVSMTNSLSSIGGNASAGNSSGGNGGIITVYSATNYSSPSGNGNDMSTKGGNATGTGSSGSGGNITMTGNAANGGLTLGRTYTTSAGTGGSGTAGTAGRLTVSTGNSVVTSGGTNDGQSGSGYPTIAAGAAPFTKTGTGIFLLGSTNNSFTGLATVSTGTLKIGANNALGTNASGTTVSNGATIDINNTNYTTTEPLALTGAGISSLGVMTTSTGTAGAWAGVVTIAGGTSIGAAASSTLTISGQVTGSGGLTKVDYGTLSLSSASNNYTGSTTIATGTVQIGAAGVIPDASAVIFNGGTLRTNGAFSETMSTLTVNSGSFITFGSAVAHTLTFANSNAIAWATGANITVSGWTGTYGAGTTGTTKLIIGSTGNVLTAAQLAKIYFIDGSGVYWSAQALTNGEIVPSTSIAGNTFYAITNGNWNTNTTWSFTPGGAAVPSGVFPASTKNVVISGYTVTLTVAAAVNNITFGSSACGLTMAANDLTVFGNFNIVTACPTISTTGGNIIFDGTNNNAQTLTSTCASPSLGNITLTNGANIASINSNVTNISVANFTNASGTSLWINAGSTTLTVTGALAAPSCIFISNGASGYNFSGATNSPITVGGLTSNSSGTINLGSKNVTISTLLSYTSGTLTSTGTISMSANSIVNAKNALTVANLQLGGSNVSSIGGGTLTVTAFDFNAQTSFTQTAGIITTGTINNNTAPIYMAYSGTPTFIYSGNGVIPSGSYYNLTTTTNTKSLTCFSTIIVDGVLTNSSGTIVGPSTSGQFGRFINANPVNNIGGTIGGIVSGVTTSLSFSGTIQGGTIVGAGTNILQNSSQNASCTYYTVSTASISGYTYCLGAGPSTAQNFTVSGSGLSGSGNVIVTGSVNYEVSSDNVTFGSSVSYPFAAGVITGQPKLVYVRLKAGLTAGAYNSEDVTVTSAGGATAKTVSNSGSVLSSCGRTWTGSTNTDWNTNTNWIPATVPTFLDDVIIPNVTNKPVVESGATANANSITINVNSSVSLSSTATLNAYGNIVNNGTVTSVSGSTVVLKGSSAQTVSGVPVLYNVQIANTSGGVSLSSALTVKGALILTSGVLTTNSNLTVNFDNGGYIAYNASDAGSISGNVSGRRDAAARTHYLASPFSGATSAQIQATTPLYVNNYWKMYTKNFDTQGWAAVTTTTTAMPIGTGFSLALPAAAPLILTGTYSHNTSFTSPSYSNAAATKYILIGNPYPSALDWDAASGWTKTNVANAVYYWDAATSKASSYIAGEGTNGGTKFIPAMQSFMVATTGTGGSTSSVSIDNAARVNLQNPSYFRTTSSRDETIRIKLTGANAETWDDAVIRFNEQATNSFDFDWDAYKIISRGPSPLIYTTLGGQVYSINSVSGIESLPVVDVVIYLPSEGNYTLSIANSDPATEYILIDKKLGTENIVSGPSYVFSGSPADDVNRFQLKLRTTVTTGINTSNTSAALQIMSSTKGFVIQTAQFGGEQAAIELLDMTGNSVEVLNNTTLATGSTFVPVDVSDGAYLVKVTIDGNVFTEMISLVR